MADPPVPVTTSIRTSRTKNMTVERLVGRLEFLRGHIKKSGEWAEQKEDFRGRVREIVAIENELCKRNVCFRPVSERRAA